jgi:starch synthase
VPDEAISDLEIPSYENILKLLMHSDAVIVASENLSSLTKFIESSGKPFYLSHQDAFAELYTNFYTNEVL